MCETKSVEVPGLGKVKIESEISEDSIQKAFDDARQNPQATQALVFSEYILSNLVVSPALSPGRVADLPVDGLCVLIDEAVRLLGLSDCYMDMPAELDPRERLYRALLAQTAKKVSSAIAVYAGLPVFNSQLIVQSVMDSINTMLSPIQESHRRLMEQMPKQLQGILQDWGRKVSGFIEVIQQQYDKADLDAQAAAPMLIRSDLWFPPSAPQSLLLAVKDVAESDNPTPEQVESLFLEYYRNEDWTPLRELCASWAKIPAFRKRMSIINDALEAHIEGKYSLSIPALLPQIEGIAGIVLGKPVARKTRDLIKGLVEQEYPAVLPSAAKDPLIRYISNILYASMDYGNYDTELELKGVEVDKFLNRPAILHGVNIDYAHVGLSLRAFLILDALSFMCDEYI